MPISAHDAMRMLLESPAATSHWARTVLPTWTDRPFTDGSYPTKGVYCVERGGRSLNYFVSAAEVAATANEWANSNQRHPNSKARSDAVAIANNTPPPWFYAVTIDEVIQIATLGTVLYKP
ncbi:hypothetical protein [Corynebacterium lubricantis]|uniref:hypothetical protein n=1 Tax=Corynebacterium lubricantis TaxID=541095 RepID=UPI000365F832|nr:hypothetical protein [Corynebacterium lubricantis]